MTIPKRTFSGGVQFFSRFLIFLGIRILELQTAVALSIVEQRDVFL